MAMTAPGPLTPTAFRDALGSFATGVAIVTARNAGAEPIGMTMSSFNSVSLDPPLVLFSVDRKALSFAEMCAARGYAINVLGRPQQHLSARFSRSREDKWADVAHSPGFGDAPVLADVLAHFECKPYAQYDGGDHVIFVCEVVRASRSSNDEEPLIFYRGKYHTIASETARGE
jgi:flavin reductase (DIM6/NTAB) family NADH-FMN oxidoreductase RutF